MRGLHHQNAVVFFPLTPWPDFGLPYDLKTQTGHRLNGKVQNHHR